MDYMLMKNAQRTREVAPKVCFNKSARTGGAEGVVSARVHPHRKESGKNR